MFVFSLLIDRDSSEFIASKGSSPWESQIIINIAHAVTCGN